jgi:serine/threonine protein kinase
VIRKVRRRFVDSSTTKSCWMRLADQSSWGVALWASPTKALDIDLRCPVTLKVISERYLGDESAWLRFVREARAAASVRHPNVASVFYLGRTGSNYFYAMEFVEGEILEHLIRRSGRVEGKLALEIATQVAAGLAAIHEQNLVHRDIKPSNVSECRRKSDSVTSGPPVEECLLTRQTRALAVVSCIVDLFAKLDFST